MASNRSHQRGRRLGNCEFAWEIKFSRTLLIFIEVVYSGFSFSNCNKKWQNDGEDRKNTVSIESIEQIFEFLREAWEGSIFVALLRLFILVFEYWGLFFTVFPFDLHLHELYFSSNIIVYLLLYENCPFFRLQIVFHFLDFLVQVNLFLTIFYYFILQISDVLC